MIQQIAGISLELSFGFERQAAAKGLGGTLVERPGVEAGAGRWTARERMGDKLTTPPQRIPDAGIGGTERRGSLHQTKAFFIAVPSRDQHQRQVLERVDVVRRQRQRAAGERHSAGDIMLRVALPCLLEEEARRFAYIAQWLDSMRARVSCSVNTRKVFVRTLP